MVLRQLGAEGKIITSFVTLDSTQKKKNIEESVKAAKESVSLDVSDGTSWCMPPLTAEHYHC